jgi:hypothetical protein
MATGTTTSGGAVDLIVDIPCTLEILSAPNTKRVGIQPTVVLTTSQEAFTANPVL